jgi:DNA polymerase-3 subunit gamma/tau
VKLCYLQQALQLTATGGTVDKKKVVETARPVAFKNIVPIAAPAEEKKQKQPVEAAPKLIIETPVAAKPAPAMEVTPVIPATESKANGKSKLSSLEAIRRQLDSVNESAARVDHPLDKESLQQAWMQFVEQLKKDKNPAWQSFEVAQLNITDEHSFEAVVDNNINQRFLEFERNKACSFLQQHLKNRKLKFHITLTENPQQTTITDLPLSSKEQYLKMVEQFPLVKELKDRLRLELDY